MSVKANKKELAYVGLGNFGTIRMRVFLRYLKRYKEKSMENYREQNKRDSDFGNK